MNIDLTKTTQSFLAQESKKLREAAKENLQKVKTEPQNQNVANGVQRFSAHSQAVKAGTEFGIKVQNVASSKSESIVKNSENLNLKVGRVVDILI